MRRARRAARTVKRGLEMFDRLQQPDAMALMKEAIDDERPPVERLGALFLDEFGPAVRELPVRKLLGLCVRAILDEDGYQLVQSGVRIHDENGVFRTGSTYELKEAADEPEVYDVDDDDDLLAELLAKVAKRLPEIQRRKLVERVEASLD
jgi:hypothetical protein